MVGGISEGAIDGASEDSTAGHSNGTHRLTTFESQVKNGKQRSVPEQSMLVLQDAKEQ